MQYIEVVGIPPKEIAWGRGIGTCSCSACAFAVTSALASAFDAKSPALKSSCKKSAKRGSLSRKPASVGKGSLLSPPRPISRDQKS